MSPPTELELVGPPPLSLDAKWCLKNFLGKTADEAGQMFRGNSAVTEDFTYMTAVGLCYYLPPALSYLQSDEEGNWEFAHGLMCALSSQVGTFGLRGEPLVLIKAIAEYLDNHRDKFGLTSRDLFDRYLKIIREAGPDTPVK